MLKGLFLGILLGVLGVAAGIYFYFATGHAPIAVTAPEMPFEHHLTQVELEAYLEKQPHPAPQVPANEKTLLAGAEIYERNCAVCHGLPGSVRTRIASGMYPRPPQLFHGAGVTDDQPWETYWKVANGIRMTGVPGFRGTLNEE